MCTVKRIYILNVVVKQEIFSKTGKQNRRRIVVLITKKNIKVMTKLPYTQH